MYLSKETIALAIAGLKGTAHPLLKVWLTLKAMGLNSTTAVVVDTKNSESALKTLFNSGDPNKRYFVPFSPTPSDEWMQGDASRSIIQTTIKKWFDGKITTVDPRGYLTISKNEDRKYRVEEAATYPEGLGDGPNGFARASGQTLSVPMTQFATWVFCREEIPDGVNDIEKYLCDKLRTLLHLEQEEEECVFGNDEFRVMTSEEVITDEIVFELCGGNPSSAAQECQQPYQLITYGAPGTGKSFRTKGETEGKTTFRTTFHPDSDYSTFVGAYKPTMKTMPRVAMINDGKDAVKAGGDEDLKTVEEITYDFIPQAFVKAYVAAWKSMAEPDENQNVKPVYLVIEEINRGNCAQIFGDLFQLLDRNDAGYSDYPIEADADLARWLKKQFSGGLGETALPADVASGKLLKLPPNLYIRATMNTSDQSLFPIDSAFKRRWDWEYVPIKDEGKGWYVKVGADKYKWWSFLEKINDIVYEETSSADKQMGYFFVKLPEGQQEIDLKKFVNKVAFYLWNDVFKDCEIREDALKLKDANGWPGEPIKFTDFFKEHSNELNEQVVKDLFEGLGVEKEADEGSEGT